MANSPLTFKLRKWQVRPVGSRPSLCLLHHFALPSCYGDLMIDLTFGSIYNIKSLSPEFLNTMCVTHLKNWNFAQKKITNEQIMALQLRITFFFKVFFIKKININMVPISTIIQVKHILCHLPCEKYIWSKNLSTVWECF